MFDHPNKHELMEYAEALAREGAGVSLRIGRHVASCAACGRQVRAMRQSIEMFGHMPEIEPSADASGEILNAARVEMRRPDTPLKQAGAVALRGAAFAATVALVSGLVFGAALQGPDAPQAASAASAAAAGGASAPARPSLEEARLRIKAYRGAVRARLDDTPETREERVRMRAMRRALSAREAELTQVEEALKQKPGCLRASEALTTNLVRHAEELEAMYTGASL
jgi:hypothetical protein